MRLLVALVLALGLHSAMASAQQEFWTVERRSAVIAVRAFAAVGDAEPSQRGTGFFVSREGYFVTAEHLVSGATRVQFSLDGTGGPWVDFSRVGAMSLGWDLALLKAPERATGFPMLPLGCPETVRREAQLRFAGFPFGGDFDQRRAEVSSNAGLEGGLQLDANAAGGFSGGPVLDTSGRVVAAISAGVARTPGFLQVVPLSRARSQLGNIGVFVPRPEECQPRAACMRSYETTVRFEQPARFQVGETKSVAAPSGWYFVPETVRVSDPSVIHGGGGGRADMVQLQGVPTRTMAQVHARTMAGAHPTWFEVPLFAELVPINPPSHCR